MSAIPSTLAKESLDRAKPALRTMDVTNCLLLALWFGLLTGFAEVIVLGVRKWALHRILFLGPHVMWMAPVMDVFLLLGPALALGCLARFVPRFVSLRTVAFVFSTAGFLGLLLIFPALHHYAAIVFSVGLAVQTARIVGARPEAFYRLVRCTTIAMLFLLALSVIGVFVWQTIHERAAIAELPGAAANAPNVLLIVLDTVRADSVSLNGYSRATTPNLEALAKTAVRFENALSTAPWTTPSHASMFTGRFPHELSVEKSKFSPDGVAPLDRTYSTLAEAFYGRGYLTSAFVANMDYLDYETGLNRGFIRYEDYPVSLQEIVLSSSLSRALANDRWLRRITKHYDLVSRKDAAQVNHDFLEWLTKQQKRPFFAFLNYYDAHEPYLPPKPFDEKFGPATSRDKDRIVTWSARQAARESKPRMSPVEVQAELDAYEGAIAYIDQQLGNLFAELDKRGLRQNTVIAVTADHGEQLGEHRLFDHGNSLYRPLLDVPLVISFSGHLPAAVVNAPVSLRDLPSTLLDLSGINTGGLAGTSLARFWQPGSESSGVSERVFSETTFFPRTAARYPISKGDMASVVFNGYHYIKNFGDGREELYDFRTDQKEEHDLAASDEGRRAIEQLRPLLAR